MLSPIDSWIVRSLIERLRGVGYEVHNEVANPGKWWFTWANPSGQGDVECGPDCTSELAAWQSAMEDFFQEVVEHHGAWALLGRRDGMGQPGPC